MFDKNIKFIDIRFITCKSLLVQLLKLIGYIQYALEHSNNDEIVLTLKIRNKYKIKLMSAVDDKSITSMPITNNEIILGE